MKNEIGILYVKINIKIIIIIKEGNPCHKSEVVDHQFYTTWHLSSVH